ncbi:hypothetical protein F4809DRAFT_235656 [Biscogniauxia mediterranea]|nr:hypothetical protein F4809DRAFT_235656 [Biscogniauxia mediterranea]
MKLEVLVETGVVFNTRHSSLLMPAILTDHVVGLLEDLFRRAAVNAHGIDQAFLSARYLSPAVSSSQDGNSAARTPPCQLEASKRFERSVRGALDRNITCPVSEANCELKIGSYELGNEAKARAR